MRTKKDIRQQLEQKDVELLDKLISRLNQMLLWEMAWGLLGIINNKHTELLKSKFKEIKEKAEQRFKTNPINEDYEPNKKFFHELYNLLTEFADRNGLGVEYDKRLAKQFAEIALAYEQKARGE